MTKEEFDVLKREQKESGVSVKTFLAGRGIGLTSYYYWKKKFDDTKRETGLIPIEIHNEGSCHSVSISTQPGEISGISIAFPNGVRAHFGKGSETVLMEVLRKSLGEPCSL